MRLKHGVGSRVSHSRFVSYTFNRKITWQYSDGQWVERGFLPHSLLMAGFDNKAFSPASTLYTQVYGGRPTNNCYLQIPSPFVCTLKRLI